MSILRSSMFRTATFLAHYTQCRAASSWSIRFLPETMYSSQAKKRNVLIARALEERKHCGFKRVGAVHIEILYVSEAFSQWLHDDAITS